MPRNARLILLIAVSGLPAGCGGGSGDPPTNASTGRAGHHGKDPPPPSLARAQCPAGAANCATATGPIFFEERVDPDGEGDAHLVLVDPPGISLPGLTVIDVEPALRPHPLPGIGEWVSAAGPVYRGSYGQRQIEATELNLDQKPDGAAIDAPP